MIPSSRILGVILVVALTLSLPTVAAASLSESYAVEGVEIAATSTQGTFVGSGTGTDGDDAVGQRDRAIRLSALPYPPEIVKSPGA